MLKWVDLMKTLESFTFYGAAGITKPPATFRPTQPPQGFKRMCLIPLYLWPCPVELQVSPSLNKTYSHYVVNRGQHILVLYFSLAGRGPRPQISTPEPPTESRVTRVFRDRKPRLANGEAVSEDVRHDFLVYVPCLIHGLSGKGRETHMENQGVLGI